MHIDSSSSHVAVGGLHPSAHVLLPAVGVCAGMGNLSQADDVGGVLHATVEGGVASECSWATVG